YLDFTGGEPAKGEIATYAEGGVTFDTDALYVDLGIGEHFIKSVTANGITYSQDQFTGPMLSDKDGHSFVPQVDRWEIVENGGICGIAKGYGSQLCGDIKVDFELKITAYKSRPEMEVAYTIINTTYDVLKIDELYFKYNTLAPSMSCVAQSNYATSYKKSDDGEPVEIVIDDKMLLYHGNEHMAEVFYGTFFADCTDKNGGVCASIYQAQQNYPKAVYADKDGMKISLVPKDVGCIEMQSGMARQQRILLRFHSADESYEDLSNYTTLYQMPDYVRLAPQVYKDADIFEDVFIDNIIKPIERKLMLLGDNHARCYGMLNWGDAPDPGYSQQGRGGGGSVWTNNEYDFSHACTLMYIRTGQRRFLDYMYVSSRHWMDIDVCHFSDDPLVYGGQWEHALKHIVGSHMACSHEWVDGLLDYYHFSGDEDAYLAAYGIAQNVVGLLESPQFTAYGALHARETGWALRTLVDMYKETNDKKWLDKCEWIVEHFESWEKKYGFWLAPYTDNAVIRVTFMIAVAITSLIRYYRISPQEKIKGMILRAVDDLIENCRTEMGTFFYKELPSLQKVTNPNVLEALAIGYELTGDKKYLEAGVDQFQHWMDEYIPPLSIAKRIEGDALINEGLGTKSFAQEFPPVALYYKAATEAGIELIK
ncbi:MAG: hypothetical protein PHE51_07275, partial [Eubacteriales bacterium]|nr:hypothetical protein [Eubacteriales bacterium]